MTKAGWRDYSVFGLAVRSAIELPELIKAEPTEAPDVIIRRGSVGSGASPPGLSADHEGLLLSVPDVARYRINAGEIVVDAMSGVAERNVRLFLLGSAFGALLHQRGLLPLHANAIEIDGKAMIFMGESGAGKSTLAAWFHDQGFCVLADDVCVVRPDPEQGPLAYPGLPRLRLSEEALAATDRSVEEYPLAYAGADDFRKYDVSIIDNARRTACPVGGVFILARGDEVAAERLRGIEAVKAIFENIYRGSYLAQIRGQQAHWAAAVQLVKDVPLFRLSRKWGLARLDEQFDLILQTVRDSVRLPS